jgi:hypothetical protein
MGIDGRENLQKADPASRRKWNEGPAPGEKEPVDETAGQRNSKHYDGISVTVRPFYG